MERYDRRRTRVAAAVALFIAAGFAFARTGAAQDPPAPTPSPEPSAAPPAPTDTAPPAPAPQPSATEEPYPEEPPAPPVPVPAPTATTPPPPAPPPTTAPAPTPPPTATGYPPAYPPPPATSSPPARKSPPVAAPAARAPAPEAAPAPVVANPGDEQQPKKEDEDDGGGLFGPFRIGPVVGVGLPSVLTFGGTVKLTRYLGGGINVGLIPTIKVSYYGEATVAYQHYEAYGRLYPFGGSFFLGAGVGYATIKGTLKTTQSLAAVPVSVPELGDSLTINSEGSVRTMMLTPTLGFFHTFGSGFSIGIEGGAQVPIAPSEVTLNTTIPSTPDAAKPYINEYFTKNDQKVRDQLEKMGQTILPTFGIKIGWLL